MAYEQTAVDLLVRFINNMPITHSLSIRKLFFSFDAQFEIHSIEKYFINLDCMYFWCEPELLTYQHSVTFRETFMLRLEVSWGKGKLK